MAKTISLHIHHTEFSMANSIPRSVGSSYNYYLVASSFSQKYFTEVQQHRSFSLFFFFWVTQQHRSVLEDSHTFITQSKINICLTKKTNELTIENVCQVKQTE